MVGPVKRSYDSSRRKDQARETERVVLAAARQLFVEQGFGRTTLVEVAEAAGVSVETLYARFRNKAGVLHRLWDVTIGGDDDEVVYLERPEIQLLHAEPDLARRLTLQARLFTQTARRVVPFLLMVQAAAGSEPAAAEMLAEMGRQRLAGISVMAAAAAATGQLAVTTEVCRDLIWAMTDGMLWHRLVQQRSWTDDQFAEHLAQVWISALVRQD